MTEPQIHEAKTDRTERKKAQLSSNSWRLRTSLKLQIEQRGRKSVRIDTKNIINQQDLTDIYWTLYSSTVKYTFFSSTHGTFSIVDHMLGHMQAPVNLKGWQP